MDQDAARADSLFLGSLEWLAHAYSCREFFVERDVVYSLQQDLRDRLAADGRGWRVYNDYPMINGPRRAFSADLAVISPTRAVVLAAEFKFEPCRRRDDVLAAKLPVTVWADILKDVDRVETFVRGGYATIAYAILVDEDRRYAARDTSRFSQTQQWDANPGHDHPVDVWIHRVAVTA